MSGNERRSSSSSSSASSPPTSSPDANPQDAHGNNDMAPHGSRGNDSTHHSGSSLSNLSNLDSETDELGKRILEHARDQKRLRDATNGTIQAFRHARPRARVALTLENLERNNNDGNVAALKQAEKVEIRATRSADSRSGSEQSESSNVPRQWGRSGRNRNEFLRRIHTYHNAEVPREDDPDAIWPRRTMYTGDSPSRRRSGDWAAAAVDIPVQSVELESPLSRPQSSSAALSRQKRTDLLAKILELEQEEARSNGDVKTSPSHKRRSSELTRLRELANVKEMGVTRNRLDELGSAYRTKSQEADLIHEEGGEFELANSNSSDERDAKPDFEAVRAAAFPAHSNAYRPGHRRQDSRDLLKQLARAASSTPSPTSRHLTSPQKRRVLSNSTSGTDRERSPMDGQQSLPTPEQTPQPPKTAPAQTPRVTGAWIETPALTKHSETSEKQNDTKPSQNKVPDITLPKRTSPKHAKSALEIVLAEATKADKNSEALGDDTIQSLKGLITETNFDADTTQLDEDTLDLIRKVSEPVHHAARDKEEENALLEAMARTLKSTRSSLKDAARSMKRVESQVETSEATKRTNGAHQHDGSETECRNCGQAKVTLSQLMRQAWEHSMSRFYSRPKNGRLTFTWLGLCTVLLVAWLFSEVALCEVYCHKTTAWYMTGAGVDLSAPEMPFVTLTILIKRPLRFILEPAGYILAWLIWVTGVGLQSLFPDAESPGFSAGHAIKAAGTRTAMAVVRSFNAGYIYWDPDGGASIT